MSRCIDVDETLKAMDTWDKFGVLPNGTVIPFRNCENADDYVSYVKYEDMVNCVKNMPTADVVPTEFHDKCMQIEIEKRRNMVDAVGVRTAIDKYCNKYCNYTKMYFGRYKDVDVALDHLEKKCENCPLHEI